MKKFLALFLCCVMLLSMLAACKGDNSDPNGTEGNTEGVTEAPEKKIDPLLVENLADYVIVYPESGLSMGLSEEVRALQTTLKDKFGTRPDSKSDYINKKNPIRDREILIGKTNRPESATVYSLAPRSNDYAVQIIGEKLVIAASSDEKMTELLHLIIESINALESNTTYFFNESMQKVVTAEYDIKGVTLNGIKLEEYTIVCANSNVGNGMAKQFADMIEETYQYRLRVMEDYYVETPVNTIIVGKTKFGLPEEVKGFTDDQYYAGWYNDNIYIYATDASVLYSAMQTLLSKTADQTTGMVELTADGALVKPAITGLTTMSFNLWVSEITDTRAAHVVERIKLIMPDTLGVQEASSNWVNRLKTALSPDYGYIGIGRDPGGKGEHSGIFYKKSTVKVIESGTKWMSDTPDTPSKYSGSTCYRIFTYGVFERLSDGERFLHVNAHTEHTSDAICLQQLQVLVNFVNKNYAGKMPIIITGDLNATEANASVQHVLKNGMQNSAKIAFKTTTASTFSPGGSIIDFCLVSEGDFIVYEYAVDTYKYNGEVRDPSDHCPVYIKYDFKSDD